MPFRNIKGLGWAALIVGSIVAFYTALIVGGRGDSYRVLEFSVDLKPGAITSPEFRVGMKGRYEITLEAGYNLPRDELERLLGMWYYPNPPEPVVEIEWTLISGDSVVASGSSRNEKGGGWRRSGVFRTLGWFDGLAETPYVLEINILRDGSALAPANPRITVDLGPEDVLDSIIIPRLKSTMITVIAIIGAVWILAFVLAFRRPNTGKNPADNSPPAVH